MLLWFAKTGDGLLKLLQGNEFTRNREVDSVICSDVRWQAPKSEN